MPRDTILRPIGWIREVESRKAVVMEAVVAHGLDIKSGWVFDPDVRYAQS